MNFPLGAVLLFETEFLEYFSAKTKNEAEIKYSNENSKNSDSDKESNRSEKP